MKKILLLLAIAALAGSVAITSCKKKVTTSDVKGCKDPNSFNFNAAATVDDGSCQMPQNDIKALVWDMTGLWCHYCGEDGIPSFEKVISDMPTNAIPISLHSGDAFSCTAGDSLLKSTFLGGTGVPRMGVNLDLVFPAGVTADHNYNATKLEGKVSNSISAPMFVGTYISKSISGSTLNVTTKTKFTDDADGSDYYLAVYVTENGLVADQVTDHGTISMTHNGVLRTSLTPIWGTYIAGGTIAKGTVIEKNFSRTIPTTLWNSSKLSIVTVLYYKYTTGSTKLRDGVNNANFLN